MSSPGARRGLTTGPEFGERPQWIAAQALRDAFETAPRFDAIDATVNHGEHESRAPHRKE